MSVEAMAHMTLEDLEEFKTMKTSATAYSIPMLGEGGETVPLYSAEEIEFLRSEIDDLIDSVRELREALQTIYANNGEVEDIARIASPLIDKYR